MLPNAVFHHALSLQDPVNAQLVDLWFEVHTTGNPVTGEEWNESHEVERFFMVTGTGHPVGDDWTFLATVRHEPSQLVWHVWEI